MTFMQKGRLFAVLILTAAVLTGVFFIVQRKANTVTLFFQSKADGSLVAEKRYLFKTQNKHEAELLVDELLLGPMDRALLHFTDSDVQPNSCFVRSGCLYLDLPARVLVSKEKTADFKTLHTALQKTISENVNEIDTVYLFVDGVPAYQDK